MFKCMSILLTFSVNVFFSFGMQGLKEQQGGVTVESDSDSEVPMLKFY